MDGNVFDFGSKRQRDQFQTPQERLVELLSQAEDLIQSQSQEALEVARAALDLATKHASNTIQGQAHLLLAKAAQQVSQVELAVSHLERAGDLSPSGSRNAAEVLLLLGRALRDQGEASRAIEHLTRAAQQAQGWGFLDLAADALNSLASLQFTHGQYGEALDTLNQAVNLARLLCQPVQEAKFLNNIAQIFTRLGHYPEALRHLLEVQARLRDAPDANRNEAPYLISIGTVHQHLGDLKAAQECFSEALRWSENHGDLRGRAAARNNLANALLRIGEHAQSETLFRLALDDARELGNPTFEVDNLDGLGELYRALGKHDQALEIHRQAHGLSINNQYPEGELDALLNLGRDHLALGSLEQAKTWLQQALEVAQRVGRAQTVYEAHEWLAATHKQMGQHQQALSHFEAFHEARKAVFQEEREQQAQMLSAQFALERVRLERRLAQTAWQDAESRIAERTASLEQVQQELITCLASTAGHDQDPHGEHAFRVAEYATRIAVVLGWSGEPLEHLRLAAQLHEVGQLRQNTQTLAGTEGPTHLHEGVRTPLLRLAEEIAQYHLEHWDGSGHPHGLSGEAIPMLARIVAIANAFDQALHDPSQPRTVGAALKWLEVQGGTNFDPTIMRAALKVLR